MTETIACANHRTGLATFVCRHLRDGMGCGFHAEPATDDDRWPDACCDRCIVGEGDLEAEDIAMVCDQCYLDVKARNRDVPAPFTAGQIDVGTEVTDALRADAHRVIHARQDQAMAAFKLGEHARWAADYDAARMSWIHDGKVQVVADMQLVGSYSKKSSSWLWSWANETNQPILTRDVRLLKGLGEVRGVGALADGYQAGVDVEHAWELTMIACHLLDFEACYRAPMDHRYLFMILKNLRWVS